MPENKEMVSKALDELGTSPAETIITIPAYNNTKPYRLHIKEVKQTVGPKIIIAKAKKVVGGLDNGNTTTNGGTFRTK